MISKQKIVDRFTSYVTVDTESDPESNTTPSTKKQWNLANALVEELKEIGMITNMGKIRNKKIIAHKK